MSANPIPLTPDELSLVGTHSQPTNDPAFNLMVKTVRTYKQICETWQLRHNEWRSRCLTAEEALRTAINRAEEAEYALREHGIGPDDGGVDAKTDDAMQERIEGGE